MAEAVLAFPVAIPRRPDGSGMLAVGGRVVDGVESGHVVPLFTHGFSPRAFLAGVGITTACEMTAFDREAFYRMLTRLMANPSAVGVAGFVIDPTAAGLTAQPLRTATDLLLALGGQPK